MKRGLITIVIFLLAGALVNVAVAWGCSVFSPLWSEVGHDCTYGGVLVVPLENLPAPSGQDPSDLGGSAFEVVEWTLFRAGLPVRSLTGHISERTLAATTGPTGRQLATYSGLWSLPRRIGPGLPHVPLIPVWPGFAVNTIFYAALLWLLICSPFVLRRLVRVKRGLCLKCGYPIGDSAVCTECGKPLPEHRSPPTSTTTATPTSTTS